MTSSHKGLEEGLVRKTEFRTLNKDVELNGSRGVAQHLTITNKIRNIRFHKVY